MKISAMSDLHLEFDANLKLPGGDILLLAGDIWGIRHMRNNDASINKAKRAGFEKFCTDQLSKYEHVLITYGNHEAYGDLIDDVEAVSNDFLREYAPNAIFLNNEWTYIEGVTFFGSPLWATCGVGNPANEMAIRGTMNDFALIRTRQDRIEGDTTPNRHPAMKYRVFSPRDANKLHEEAVDLLSQAIPTHKHCIVFTHHAPSFMSAGGHSYYDGALDSAYCSNQHALIEANPHIHAWIHGHTHKAENYKIGSTRILSNPRGYMGHESIARDFDPSAIDFDLSDILGADAKV
jgi:hypothetical protein